MWIVECKRYLSGEVDGLDSAQVERCAKLAPSFEVDARGLLRYVSLSGRMSPHDGTEDPVARVVLPTTLHEEILSHHLSVWTAAIKVCPERSRGSARRSTGAACFGVCRRLWSGAQTAPPARECQGSMHPHPVTSLQPDHFRSLRWTSSPRCLCPSWATRSCWCLWTCSLDSQS
ncbi:TPA: hypothetical protein N0F65_010856 [Lagenidium giganteum]|uniref:Uncharacterized protein n=1 Tax=Lagenidium giganteum TaxID=4803 RepID=A0AAV2Z6S4_9STRA|nr:TPA: hypothetical protein N0F65_010856 [Lagenidium giganteum]